MTVDGAGSGPMEARTRRRLLGFALAVIVGHHDGFLLAPLGEVGPTRWADWLNLALPLAVLGFAGATLLSSEARRRTWLVFALGALLYAQGHGLAANSVSNVDPGETAHLWDEVVGHYLWYGGLAFVVAALALDLAGRPVPARPWAYALAALFGYRDDERDRGRHSRLRPRHRRRLRRLGLALPAHGLGAALLLRLCAQPGAPSRLGHPLARLPAV